MLEGSLYFGVSQYDIIRCMVYPRGRIIDKYEKGRVLRKGKSILWRWASILRTASCFTFVYEWYVATIDTLTLQLVVNCFASAANLIFSIVLSLQTED